MALSAGDRLGPYEIVAPLGAGGMGEVYRAKDTRLGREVAIKVLPAAVAQDAERLARFKREAQLLAALNHPNIAAIYGLDQAGDELFLALELVEGEDLAERLNRGAVPLEEALAIARQIALALEEAHEKGIVHRDLKSANVKLTPDGKVKVLDFGLAKALESTTTSAPRSDPAMSPTITSLGTVAGVILGTAAYMSPEQARGKSVDKRADIWAFGCVLYELLTARRPFDGETISDTLAAVLTRDADWSLLPATTPARAVGLLRRCLVKDPKQRLRDIGDARLELDEAIAAPPEPAMSPAAVPRRTGIWPWIAGGLLAGALAAFGGLRLLAPSVPAPELRKFSIPIPELAVGFDHASRISPDGRRVVYASRSRLWIRDLSRFEATEIPGSEGAISPFWSSDSTHVGFAKDRKIWTWALAGGESTSICAIPGVEGFNHATWGSDGKIYLAAWRGGLYEVAAAGGEPRLVLAPGSDEVDFHHPCLLPDGRHLVTVAHRKKGSAPVVVVSLPDGGRKDLASFEGLETVVYAPSGHLLLSFTTGQQKILAVPFKESTREIAGEPFLVAAGGQFPSVSSTGTMLYYLGSSYAQREMTWVEHEGRSSQLVGRSQLGLDSPALSPDGRRVAVVAYDKENADIWIHDLSRGTRSRVVAGPQNEIDPAWSPSGDRIFFLRTGNVASTLMEIPADGTGTPRILADGVSTDVFAVSPDGRALAFAIEKEGHSSLWRLDLAAGAAPVRLTPNASVQESQPAISPDGRWLAYVSDEAGPSQVFVRSFPDGAHKQQVSLDEGMYPFWARTGATILYWQRDALMEVPVQAGASLAIGAARRLFTAADVGMVPSEASGVPALDLAADGRFLIVRRSSDDPRRGILVVENWLEEFRKR